MPGDGVTGWDWKTVGEVAEVIGGGTPSTKDPANFGGDIPWITPNDLATHQGRYIERGERNITEAGLRFSSARLLPAGTVLLSSRAPIGYVAIAANPVSTNQGFRSLVLRDGNVPEFFYYLMSSSKALLESRANGTTFKEISGSNLKQIRLLVPPVKEQQAIAGVLGALDDKIELNRRMNETLEGIARAVFRSWFVDFDPVRAKAEGREPYGVNPGVAALFPDAMEGSPLGTKPVGWSVAPLSQIIEVNPRRALPRGQVAPYLDMANMPTSSARALEVYERPFGSGTKFMDGDTLVARITPCLENGKTAFVDFLGPSCVGWGSTEYIVLRPRPPLPQEYAYFLARTDAFRSFAISNMTGTSGRQRVPASALDHFYLAVPPPSIAEAFGNFARTIFGHMKANDEQSRTLADMRDALLPKLLSGEIRPREAEAMTGPQVS